MSWRLLWLIPPVILIPLTVAFVGGFVFGLPRLWVAIAGGVITGVATQPIVRWAVPRKDPE